MKIEIDVTEEEYKDSHKNLIDRNEIINKVQEAYKAQRDRIRKGEWFRLNEGKHLYYAHSDKNAKDVSMDKDVTRLSKPLQDLLNKEIS